ncbi:Aste57867_21644 [Aphanomyces stellatus]|uniref:Aste57867_21644 protein n=1 Tax=Aphanomyces stellatus TaxID=120398 RepID=A0A485LJE2_9STRA|nr:hypothetical protein As57867_021575 [Aphanomyces stellatus]VFT98313.1 Aste57867_21644 [Aphanomyces stellatus]
MLFPLVFPADDKATTKCDDVRDATVALSSSPRRTQKPPKPRPPTLGGPVDTVRVIESNVTRLRALELAKLPYMTELAPYRARRHPESLSTLGRCTMYTMHKKRLELQAQTVVSNDHVFPGTPSVLPHRRHLMPPPHTPSPPPSSATFLVPQLPLPSSPSSPPFHHSSPVASSPRLSVTYRRASFSTQSPPQLMSPPKPVPLPPKRKRTKPPKLSCPFGSRSRPEAAPGDACHPTHVVTKYHGHLSDYNIEALMAETGFDRAELYTLWGRFKALCSLSKSPRGIDQDTFRTGVPLLSIEDSLFVDRVFAILDVEQAGLIDWTHFIRAMSALDKGDARDRIRFLFQVYDLNCDGTIGQDELATFFVSSLMVNTPNDDLHEVTRQFVDEILHKMHPTGGGVVSVQDVLNYIERAPGDDLFALFGRTMLHDSDRHRGDQAAATSTLDDNDDDDAWPDDDDAT